MNIPTSLIFVVLAVAWLLLLVPMIARRRERVHRFPAAGAGLRVLQRASNSLRTPRRRRTTSHPSSLPREEHAVTVGTGPEHEPMDAAEEWAAEQAHRRPRTAVAAVDREDQRPETDRYVAEQDDGERYDGEQSHDGGQFYGEPVPRRTGSTRYQPPAYVEPVGAAPDGAEPSDAEPSDAEPSDAERNGAERTARLQAVAEAPAPPAPVQDEWDERDWESSRGGATGPSDYDRVTEHHDEELRPVPRRAGRGGFDPDAAEATRAYRYQQRRRVTLVLLVATVVFALGAILASGLLWWPAGLAGVLLVTYLAYLRRQVKIEAQIRARRMEKLQRARQVRPAVQIARARADHQAALYRNRRVVDVEDDDPAFEHLEYHEAEPYRRAVGQ